MTFNPILVRETRARFRHWGAFVLLLGYVALLATTAGFFYADALRTASFSKNPLFRLPAAGHGMFVNITCMQVILWMLIAPALTASSLAREREDGLLDSVLLSPLKPRQIFSGKLLSALSIVVLLILVSLPVQAICFMMGGISPLEFLVVLAMLCLAATTCAVIGLACSSRSRRANEAMTLAYMLVIGWLILSATSLGTGLVSGAKANLWVALFSHLAILFGWTNPVVAIMQFTFSEDMGTPGLNWGMLQDFPWAISICFQLLLCMVLTKLSTHALRRPLDARGPEKLARILKPVSVNPQKTRATKAQQEWNSFPGSTQLCFSNPVLQREIRGKFRIKAPALWVTLTGVLLLIVVANNYLLTLKEVLFHPLSREAIWWGIVVSSLFMVALVGAVMGAGTFSRERENHSWEALRLSLLSPKEIVNGKLFAILLAFALYSLPLWPLLIPCINPALTMNNSARGISLSLAMATVGLVAATGYASILWGMWWSWRSKRTATAVGWTLGSLFFLQIFLPLFIELAGRNFGGRGAWEWMWLLNPLAAYGATGNNELPYQAIICTLSLTTIGTLIAHVLRRQILRSEKNLT